MNQAENGTDKNGSAEAEPIHILFCGDENVADGVLLATLSILAHVVQPLHIFLFTAAVGEGDRQRRPMPDSFAQRLQTVVQRRHPDSRVTRVELTEQFAACPPTANMDTRFTPLCMLRLYADLVAEIPDRLLYLDCDVLCRRDFTDFYRQDMTGVELCGVLDRYGSWFFHGGHWRRNYINSGVLLMNMAEIRRSGLFARCRALCRDERMFMPDQSALNRLAHKRLVSRCYNEQADPRPDTVFQHFSTRFRFFPYIRTVTVKPWEPQRVHEVLGLRDYDELYAQYWKEKEV